MEEDLEIVSPRDIIRGFVGTHRGRIHGMPTFKYRSEITATAADVFDWHSRPGAFERMFRTIVRAPDSDPQADDYRLCQPQPLRTRP